MTVTHEELTDHHLIKLRGDFDAILAPEARTVFAELTDNIDKDVVLNFAEVKFMDSSGVGALVFLFKRLREAKVDLMLENLNEQPAELIKLLRIDQIIKTR